MPGPGRPFKKGDGRPRGRPRGSLDTATLLEKKGIITREETLTLLANAARAGDIKAIIELTHYFQGKPKEIIDVTTNGNDINSSPLFAVIDDSLKNSIQNIFKNQNFGRGNVHNPDKSV